MRKLQPAKQRRESLWEEVPRSSLAAMLIHGGESQILQVAN